MIRLQRLSAFDFKQLKQIQVQFPPAGRILVQGKNEAGKSTLFEAVFFALFGQALTTESGPRNLDDLIGYDKEKARVELDLVAGERTYKITRTLIRGKANKWELEIVRADGATEEVRSNKAVNDRLVAELGFDAEALLNTCFVEQKKLEKLEGMSKAKREESLSKLLNLERLLELEDELKLRGEDERGLTRLKHRVELARAQAELPGVEQELMHAEADLKLLDLRVNIERAIQESNAGAVLGTQLEELGAKRAALAETVARVDALDQARQRLDTMLVLYTALGNDKEQLGTLEAERAELERAAQEHLPALETRQREIRRLGVQAARLTRVEAIRAHALLELQRAQDLQHELDGHLERGQALNAAIAEHEARLAALDEKLRAYDTGDALGEWRTAVQEAAAMTEGATELTEKQRAREALNHTQRQYLIYLIAVAVAIGVVSALVLPALVWATNNLLVGVLVALVLAALATLAILALASRLIRSNRQTGRLNEEIGKLEGEMSARRRLAADAQGRVSVAAEKLRALGVSIPADVDAAQAKRVELAATLENKTRAELVAERDDVREKWNYARAQREQVVQRIDELSPAQAGAHVEQLECARDKAERILDRWRPRLARRAAQYDVPPETEALRDAYRTAQADIKGWQQRLQQADKLAADCSRLETRIVHSQNELQEQYEQVAQLLDGGAPAWTPQMNRAAYLALQMQLVDAFQAAGGAHVRASLTQLEKQLGALEREQAIRTKYARDAVVAARAIERELGLQDGLAEQPTLEELQALAARLDTADLEERPALDARVKRLHQRVGELRGTCERLERELGLVGETVELESAQRELESEQRAQLQRKYGAEIVARARKRIVQKILPATMEYMRRILPQITRDRYHDAELDPESYKIRVWDERAGQSGAWKEKNIFSGGTKDQFSLALRLAFALATLPQERNASPGFIFLDEPLGSFDDERANALLYLLTEGEIGRAFDQIFLISHVPVQENKFTHRIRLENGTVVDGNLKES